MTVLFTDSGTGADQSPLSGNFTTLAPYAGLRRASNLFANITDSTDSAALITAGTFPNDQWCEVEVGVVGTPDGGPLLRGSATGNGVFLTSYNNLSIFAFSIVASIFNQEDEDTGTYSVGSVVYFEVQGNAYVSKLGGSGGTVVNSFTFTGLSTGRPGMFMYNGTLRFLNLRAGDFATGSNIAPTGIASPNALGAHTIATAGGQTIAPTGIASPRALGSHEVMKEVVSAGVPSAAVYGAHSILDVVLDVAPTGIASARALGTHTVADVQLSVTPPGIDSARVTGSHSVANAGAQNIAPTGIASPRVTGSHTLASGGQTVAPTGIGSVAALGSHVLANIVQSVAPVGIASARVLGAPIIQAGQFFIAPVSITTPSALGAPAVEIDSLQVAPAGVESARALGAHALAFVNPQAIVLTGIGSLRAFGSHAFAVVEPPVIIEYLGRTELFVSANVTLFEVTPQ